MLKRDKYIVIKTLYWRYFM